MTLPTRAAGGARVAARAEPAARRRSSPAGAPPAPRPAAPARAPDAAGLPRAAPRRVRCAAKGQTGRITYWKDGQELEITEDEMPLEDQRAWEEAGREASLGAPLWDLVQKRPDPGATPVLTHFSAPAAGATGEKASLSRASLQISKMDFTVNSIIDKINRGKVNLRPSYQREYVWTTRTASRLVESLLLNVPIPTMFFHETERGNMEVVDGKQRLTSIWAFMMEEFPDGTPFKLTGLEVYEELNGRTFSDLTEAQQETIKDYPLNVHTISRQSQPDFVFEVFERLNMGATQLNEQELRNCIYQGAYTELLGSLARNAHLLRIYKSASPHLRMRDRELILRFFAMLRTGPQGFQSPVKTWLNEEIRAHRELAPSEAARMADVFERAIGLAWHIFGDCAFRPVRDAASRAAALAEGGGEGGGGGSGAGRFETGEVNVALWDTVLYSLAQYEPEALLSRKDAVLEAFVGLAGDAKFRRLLVSQPKAVAARAEAWAKVLERVLGDAAPPAGASEAAAAAQAVAAARAEARAEDAESWAGLD